MAESDIEPPRGTSIRPLAKLFAGASPLWIFDHEGRIAYASAECGRWLGIDPQRLLGHGTRSAEPSTSSADDFLERLATSMAPPAGVARGAVTAVTVRPPAASAEASPPAPRSVLFLPLGPAALPASDRSSAGDGQVVLAVADLHFPERPENETVESRELLDEVARQLAASPTRAPLVITLGSTVAAQRLNHQIDAACAAFHHVTLVCPPGSPAEAIVRHIHASTPVPGLSDAGAARGKAAGIATGDGPPPPIPLVPVDGPLMDAELFDATTGNLINQLVEGDASAAALLVHHIDQMPGDAQARLELLIHNHPHRLRLFATTTGPTAEVSRTLLPALAALIGTFELRIPPLSERIEDIPQLAAALLERRRHDGETRAEKLGRDAIDRLVLYPWPGNFEELAAAIRSAARECRGETVRVEHLPLAIRSFGSPRPATLRPTEKQPRAVPLDQALERLEGELIRRALDHSGGNRAAAARQLGISRPRLLRRIDQLGVDRAEHAANPERPNPERPEQ